MDNLGGIYYDLMRPAVLACDDMEELRQGSTNIQKNADIFFECFSYKCA